MLHDLCVFCTRDVLQPIFTYKPNETLEEMKKMSNTFVYLVVERYLFALEICTICFFYTVDFNC